MKTVVCCIGLVCVGLGCSRRGTKEESGVVVAPSGSRTAAPALVSVVESAREQEFWCSMIVDELPPASKKEENQKGDPPDLLFRSRDFTSEEGKVITITTPVYHDIPNGSDDQKEEFDAFIDEFLLAPPEEITRDESPDEITEEERVVRARDVQRMLSEGYKNHLSAEKVLSDLKTLKEGPM